VAYGGEPHLPRASGIAPGPSAAAVRFVHDYASWSSRRVATMPGRDVTWRVLGLLEHRGRLGTVDLATAIASVRIARASTTSGTTSNGPRLSAN
jgi:hypothetical protein